MSLVVLLTSSSFFLPAYLVEKLQTAHFNDAQLFFAEKLSLPKAFEIKQSQQVVGSRQWLFYTTKLAKFKGQAAFDLAQFYLPKQPNVRQENLTKAMIRKGVFWYKQAIRLESEPAKLVLANWYFSQDKLNKANELINSLLQQTSESAVLKTKILIAKGVDSKSDIKKLTDQLVLLALSEQGKLLINAIQRYQILPRLMRDNVSTDGKVLPVPLCTASIQFFATSLADLYRSEQLISQFKVHRLNEFVCFAPVRYRSIKKLKCYSKLGNARQCDESQWVDIADNIPTRFVGIMLPHGGANVHLGMLYIDRQDTSAVFAHEISHLLGFIDEYPLPINHHKCQQVQTQAFSENIAVLKTVYFGKQTEVRANILHQLAWAKHIKNTTPILYRKDVDKDEDKDEDKDKQAWFLGTPKEYNNQVGVFVSESCDNTAQQAFKPVLFQTQLRYYEKPFPEVYSRIIREDGLAFLMPSFHYNLALALLNHESSSSVKKWLDKAASFEYKNRRKKQILTATF